MTSRTVFDVLALLSSAQGANERLKDVGAPVVLEENACRVSQSGSPADDLRTERNGDGAVGLALAKALDLLGELRDLLLDVHVLRGHRGGECSQKKFEVRKDLEKNCGTCLSRTHYRAWAQAAAWMDGDGKAQRPAEGELCGLAKRARARTQYGRAILPLSSPSASRAELKAEYAQLVGEVSALEREVRDRELLLAAIGSMKEGIVITDPSLHDNPIVWANERFYSMTGYSEKETLNRNCASFVYLRGSPLSRPLPAGQGHLARRH